jgi:hypothetical protein
MTLSKVNRAAVDTLNAFLTRQPVGFIGAGMTRPHYLGWNDLLARLAVDLGIALEPGLDPIHQAEKFYRDARAAYEASLITFYGPTPTGCRPGLRELVKLNFGALLTTNFDYSIHHAFMLNGGPAPVCLRYPSDLQVSLCRVPRHVFFVHGAVKDNRIEDLDNFILHESAYLKAYFGSGGSGPGPLMNFLFDMFNQNDVVFIGYGLGRAEPIRFALRAANASLGAARGRLMLVAGPITASDKDAYKYQFGIDLIEYEPIDAGHSGLDAILTELSALRVINPPAFDSPLSSISASLWRTP